MAGRRAPTRKEVDSYLRDRRNWGRWGAKGGAGAINLITPEVRVAAARLVVTGRTVSLSRPFPVTPASDNPRPAQHYVYTSDRPPGGAALDFYGVAYHGITTTHIDALCHVWNENGMWDGRDPRQTITFSGARYGTVDEWSDGILTRGVLLDVPKHRGEPYVTLEKPIHGWELEDIARDHDISILGWDMMDASPNEYGIPWTVHGAIFAYGVALLDNALLEPLSRACAEEGRYVFMLTINPLRVIGGTGSPANPIAVF